MALSQIYHYYLSNIYTYYYYKLQLYVKKKNICNSWANKWKSEKVKRTDRSQHTYATYVVVTVTLTLISTVTQQSLLKPSRQSGPLGSDEIL